MSNHSNSNDSTQAFYDLNQYPDFKYLTTQYTVILEELKANNYWMNWGSDAYDNLGHCQFLTGDWTICPVYFGKTNPQNIQNPGMNPVLIDIFAQNLPYQFPETTKLLKSIKSINFSAFSRLHKKSKLAPHRHRNPRSLIFHMGLIIPPENSCGLKVGNEVHLWKKAGESVIFNDTLEHSAWNDSDEERIIFYTDFTK